MDLMTRVLSTNSSRQFGAALSARHSEYTEQTMGLLLASCAPVRIGARRDLWATWADEALHRAYYMTKLYLRRHQGMRSLSQSSACDELACAQRLFENMRALNLQDEIPAAACRSPLLCIVQDLFDVFRPSAGHIVLRMDIDEVILPCFKRRALVLLACELVANALLHGFEPGQCGQIVLSVEILCGALVRMRVTDTGHGIPDPTQPPAGDVACGLARILNARLHYSADDRNATIAVLEFSQIRPATFIRFRRPEFRLEQRS